MTLDELNRRFPDEPSAQAHLFKLRWPNGVRCPRCDSSERIYPRRGKSYRWVCKSCAKNGYGFSLTTGTIFQDTKYPLRTWFQVLFLMLNAKKGKSALEIKRDVFKETASYETVWYMCHRLRAAMKDGRFLRLTGVVEVDETFVGGKAKNAHKGNRGKGNGGGVPPKAPVIGAISRKGNVVCRVIEEVDRKTMQDFVTETVSTEVSLVATDEAAGYERLNKLGYLHESVNHSQGEYVRGLVHTAHIDSFWSLLKRGIMGTFHKMSKDYLPLYLNEFSFRHNNRKAVRREVFDRVLEAC